MEEEVSKLQKCLQDKDEQLRSSASSTEQVKNFHSKMNHFLQPVFVYSGCPYDRISVICTEPERC
jgi:hypothetical protein